jgi:hypothetical protein
MYPQWPVEWDPIEYMGKVIQIKKWSLYFGRVGFILSFHILFEFLNSFINIEASQLLTMSGAFFGTVLLIMFFKYFYRGRQSYIALFSFLILSLYSNVFFTSLMGGFPEPYVCIFIIIFLFLVDKLFEKTSLLLIVCTLFVFLVGLSFKETILYFLSYPIFLLLLKKNAKGRFKIISLSFFGAIAAIFLSHNLGFFELEHLLSPLKYRFGSFNQMGNSLSHISNLILEANIIIPLSIPAILFYFYSQGKENKDIKNRCLTILYFLTPALFFLVVFRETIYSRHTFFIYIFLLLLYLEALFEFSFQIRNKYKQTKGIKAFAVIFLLGLYGYTVRNYFKSYTYVEFTKRDKVIDSLYRKDFFKISELRSVVITGDFSFLAVYHGAVNNSYIRTIFTGWQAREEGIEYLYESSVNYKRKGYRVFFCETCPFPNNEKKQISELKKKVRLVKYSENLSEVILLD